MHRIPVVVAEGHAERRLDAVCRSLLREVGHGELCRWLRRGLVRVNGRRATPALRVTTGDQIDLPGFALGALVAPPIDGAAPAPPAEDAPPVRRRPLQVVYEDDDLLVVDKPAGLASHGGIGHAADNLAIRVAAHCASGQSPGTKVGLAQRLDRDVSGLVVCGRHPRALRRLMGPPHGPKIGKIYLAVVDGRPPSAGGRIVLPLRITDQPRGDAPKVVVDRLAGVYAETHYRVLLSRPGRSLLAIGLVTGRTHQIRAHLRALGTSLLGDPRYGSPLANDWAHATFGTARPLLHAAYVSLVHPMREPGGPTRPGGRLALRATVPADLSCAMGVDVEAAIARELAAGTLVVELGQAPST